MAASVVQSNSASTTTTPATVVLGSAPTVGNTLVAIMSSDTTSSAVPFAGSTRSYTVRVSQVNFQGFYVWTRLVVSGDSATTTFTPNGANPAGLMVIEVAGTYDKVGTGLTQISQGGVSNVAPTGLTPATTDGLTLAIGGLHNIFTACSGGSVNNGFTFTRSQWAAGTGITIGGALAAALVTTTTAATGTTTLSFTGTVDDRDGVQIAFTGLGGAPAIPPILVMQTRRAY